MKEREARDLVTFVFGGFNREPTKPQLEAWAEVVEPLDADICMRVARTMHRSLERLPTPAIFLTAVRAELGREQRAIAHGPRCEICQDDGFVVVYRRLAGQSEWMRMRGIAPAPGSAIEEFGPCPRCERGKAREAAAYPDGFWQGRQWRPVKGVTREVELLV